MKAMHKTLQEGLQRSSRAALRFGSETRKLAMYCALLLKVWTGCGRGVDGVWRGRGRSRTWRGRGVDGAWDGE